MLKPNKKEDNDFWEKCKKGAVTMRDLPSFEDNDSELLQKCLKGAISQKDLPSYKNKYDTYPEIDELKKPEGDFYERQTHDQLVIFCHSHDRIEASLRKRLKALTGCCEYGNPDGMSGGCVDCYYNNRKLWENCYKFEEKLHEISL